MTRFIFKFSKVHPFSGDAGTRLLLLSCDSNLSLFNLSVLSCRDNKKRKS